MTLPIVNFTFIGSDIPASSAYVVYISQLVRYCRTCVQYIYFPDRVQLLKKGYVGPRLEYSSQKLYGRHHNLGDRYEIVISQMTMDLLLFTWMFSFFYHCQDFCRTWLYMSNTVCVLLEAGTAYRSRTPGLLVECVLLVCFYCLCWPIMCLYVLSSVLWCPLQVRVKPMLDSSLTPVVCRRAYVLCYLCI